MDRATLKRALVSYAIRQGQAQHSTPLKILEAMQDALMSDLATGKTVVNSGEGSASVAFALLNGSGVTDALEVVTETLIYIEDQANPAAPALPRPRKRMRVSFAKATV